MAPGARSQWFIGAMRAFQPEIVKKAGGTWSGIKQSNDPARHGSLWRRPDRRASSVLPVLVLILVASACKVGITLSTRVRPTCGVEKIFARRIYQPISPSLRRDQRAACVGEPERRALN